MTLKLEMQAVEHPESTVAVSTELDPGQLEVNATRLRSWALIMSCRPAGPPFIRIHDGARLLELPIEPAVEPHPETGLLGDAVMAGDTVVVRDVDAKDLDSRIAELDRALSGTWRYGPIDFCPEGAGFGRGRLRCHVAPVGDSAAHLSSSRRGEQ